MPDLPPMESIRAFAAAARHDSFVRAGQELELTAAAISQPRNASGRWRRTSAPGCSHAMPAACG